MEDIDTQHKVQLRRVVYIVALVAALALWIAFGSFVAVEAPYVNF